jgi:hypothetical protein
MIRRKIGEAARARDHNIDRKKLLRSGAASQHFRLLWSGTSTNLAELFRANRSPSRIRKSCPEGVNALTPEAPPVAAAGLQAAAGARNAGILQISGIFAAMRIPLLPKML